MGSPMVCNLRRAGYETLVYTRTKKKADEVLEAGAQWFEGDQVLIGAGFALRAGPVLLFAQSTNIPGLILPENHKTWQGSFGLVLAFGRPNVGGEATGTR